MIQNVGTKELWEESSWNAECFLHRYQFLNFPVFYLDAIDFVDLQK